MFKNLKNFLNSRARRKAAEQMPRDEKGRFLDTTPAPAPAPEPVVAPSATEAPAKKAPAKKAPAKKATPAAKKAAAPKKK
jgi:hypothetical protein